MHYSLTRLIFSIYLYASYLNIDLCMTSNVLRIQTKNL
jgi:hypothetical protein